MGSRGTALGLALKALCKSLKSTSVNVSQMWNCGHAVRGCTVRTGLEPHTADPPQGQRSTGLLLQGFSSRSSGAAATCRPES